ncbi:D-alanyl-D-alanine carboxypeptidase/D-alanyl-D-alanine-endopeptidase [Roseobacter sp. HKCCD9010]|nr:MULTISPECIES: D-alanyl-D-alanine carboxypeptidase/D-alanyl-D-alanine-endopeptidase [unclassified Roseobacter]MBF9051565.1 D-alanyl-D-alanine carboxypeptidase/D-alanyl-D-alanine-endopeptidase [Rhodobacterales bacterium HKCCD4356]NNV13089.1 D-alanyl-D-alanine carboxypeptidase/D-alanyl-D-alanine-endopeptidase [Roseobacter sp. HKCCD7357]NNV17340.1 D-alanyl-D-alanine carboxypeptidase/D-alanyl-D-alanine-endopeptidase [Roseobacter sp. HKCCD8768]NNV26946.1 D-alanyl-D-alanine carboxypeptidase/D-alany
MISRRIFVGGALAGLAQPAWAMPPDTSLRPMVRPTGLARRAIPSAVELIAEARLGGRVGFAVADARTGEMLEVVHPLFGMPPASVAKAITCAYGLDRLGPGYRFRTRLVADGPVQNGRLDGDLWLVGGGDPLLGTDQLSAMARSLRESGLREVTGRLMLASNALPYIRAIDPEQPAHVGYNPAISGLNLNFNRVHFEWARDGGEYSVQMDARSETLRPPVARMRMRVADRDVPVYTYEETETRENWTVARRALGNGGSRWLPVRRPHLYAGEVFQVLARSNGIVLAGPGEGVSPQNGSVLAEHVSEPLEDILRGMMRWSTNITAEAVGLSASIAGGAAPGSLDGSAAEMNTWMNQRLGSRHTAFIDHSGLGDASRVRPQDMTHALVEAGANGMVRRLMKDIPMRDAEGNLIADHPVEVVAKTGTLNFVSSLAGYARAPGGRDLAFSIFCADLDRRQALNPAQMERPEGGRSYTRRSKRLQQRLIERWAGVYG